LAREEVPGMGYWGWTSSDKDLIEVGKIVEGD
jgi:hypothetical protein